MPVYICINTYIYIYIRINITKGIWNYKKIIRKKEKKHFKWWPVVCFLNQYLSTIFSCMQCFQKESFEFPGKLITWRYDLKKSKQRQKQKKKKKKEKRKKEKKCKQEKDFLLYFRQTYHF